MPPLTSPRARASLRRLCFGLFGLAFGCGGGKGGDAVSQPSGPPTYVVEPPAGKVPFPHQAPSASMEAYARLKQSLFILNNFATFQAFDASHMYLHGGLDFMLPNGTAIYALQEGVVREMNTGTEYYKSVLVEDAGDPTHGWEYVHVDQFGVGLGDRVYRGQRLANVRFQGMEHLHLNRVVRDADGVWRAMWAEDRFDIQDPEPPVLRETFYYVPAGGATPLPRTTPMTLRGALQVVVGVREQGPQAHSHDGTAFGDRIAPRRFRVLIRDSAGQVCFARDCDFARIHVPRYVRDPEMERMAAQVFAYPTYFDNADWTTRFDHCFSYFKLTGFPAQTTDGPMLPPSAEDVWDTAKRDAQGNLLHPNGAYTVELTVWDANGNAASGVDRVQVEN